MSKIQSIETNYNDKFNLRFKQNFYSNSLNPNSSRKISFCGSAAKLVESAEKSAGKLASETNFFIKFDEYFNKNKEQKIILVTAFGTGVVAPIVLALNPIAKEDENTKKYTALRQPLSAGLAVISQVGINIPVAKGVDWLGAQGLLGYHNLPNPKDKKLKFTPETQAKIEEQFKTALSDEEFRKCISEFMYKEELDKIKFNATKDVKYTDRLFNRQVKDAIKKEIQEKSEKVKKLGIEEIKLEHAIKYTSNNFTTFKNLAAIAASVAVLYPTFKFLNWIYPRFVERFFPQLIKDKDEKGTPTQPVVTGGWIGVHQTDKDENKKAGA